MNSQVKVIGPGFSTCVRSVLLVCEEKQIPYETGMTVDGQPLAMHSQAHFALHPFGKVPVLVHEGRRLVETQVILRYLDTAFGPSALQGDELWEQIVCDQWCALISQYVDRHLVRDYMLELAFPKGADGRPRLDKVEAARPRALEVLTVVARQLGRQRYLLGERFSLADALLAPMLSYNAEAPELYNLVGQFDNLPPYVERLRERPAGQIVLRPAAESLVGA